MLQQIHDGGRGVSDHLARCKDKDRPERLMGFGHRLYKGMDPRAAILKNAAHELLESMHVEDPLLDVAREVEEAALSDDYFVDASSSRTSTSTRASSCVPSGSRWRWSP